MLSPIIKTLNESNKFKKIKIVTWIPNIFQEKIEIISFKNFLKEIFLLKNNYVLVSPTVNIIHSLFVLIRKPCFGFFSNNHFFSNIHKYQINFKFDPINSHFNKRLFPFLALFKIKKIKYLKLKKKKISLKNINNYICINPFKLDPSMQWTKDKFIELIICLKKS